MKTTKKRWNSPEINILDVKTITAGGAVVNRQENTNGANNKRPS